MIFKHHNLTQKNGLFSSVSKKNIMLASMVLAFTVLLTSCSDKKKQVSPKINEKLAYSLVEKVTAIVPRHSGTEGAARAADFISRKAKEFGAVVKIQQWEELTPAGKIVFRNVIAEKQGEKSDFIVIGSHYDAKKLASVPSFSGANDSGSSTGLLLAMIKAVTSTKELPKYSLRFVFFDGEECLIKYNENDGLYGSRHYVKTLKKTDEIKKCRAAIILDLIGDKDLTVTLPQGSDPELLKELMKIVKEQGKTKYFSMFKTGIIDDHTPFQRAKIPAIDIIDFKFGPGNCYWHTKADSMDKISAESLKIVGNITLQLIWNL